MQLRRFELELGQCVFALFELLGGAFRDSLIHRQFMTDI